MQQMKGLTAMRVHEEGSLQLEVGSSVLLPMLDTGPIVEGTYFDDDANWDRWDQPRVHVRLHAWKRKLDFLEIFKDDASDIIWKPDPNKLELFTYFPVKVG
jgi:hypothetical protein